VFTSSAEQADKLSARGIRNVVALSAGVDRRVFRPDERSEAERRRWLGDRTNALLLVAAGRLAGEKRWDVVIDAFLKFREHRAAVLVLFGEGPERPFLERRAAACPDIVFAGFEPDPVRLARAFASADALVHGGPYETFGIAVAQAASCGAPLVVPDRGGAAALVDLRAGARYRAMDADACAAALERLFSGDVTALRERAVTAADRVPDTGDQFTHMVRVYRRLLAEKRWKTPTVTATG
jgi:alpha-1,6-mannosyltransferase